MSDLAGLWKRSLTCSVRCRSEEMLFSFLEAYLDRMEGAIAVQVWSTLLTFVREFLSNISTSRPYIFSCLR